MLEKDKVILEKIIKYSDKIFDLLKKFNSSKEVYLKEEMYQLSTDMCVYQIGELSIHVSEDFKLKNLNIPWAEMRGMRNIHAHEYDNVNREEMWYTLVNDIPDLKNKILKLLENK